ncbi:hypothetical protein OG369_39920 [Streptomyces sp. NBC_01221]|uniref:hypothetical protein n=1 Tax=Streptomyces sp. NBC_01221 TaxID=2903782 RepID=UPI0022566E18|nr:hypothetical protein [Streptomyces sp. NBC_01221]MCX4792018.1 hypothetical protein [Streptomyces sp. NBC_01221]
MTYLVINDGRVLSAHPSLNLARAAEAQGSDRSTEAGPLLAGEPAWWSRARQNGGAPELGIVRTEATELGVRFELRACQAPAGTCDHQPCTVYATWAVSSSYQVLSGLAVFVPASWIWAGERSHDARGDEPTFRAEAKALIDNLTAELRPALRAVARPPADTRTLGARQHDAHARVVRFLARQFEPGGDTADAVRIRPVLVGRELHLTLYPSDAGGVAVCGTRAPEQADAAEREQDIRECGPCFGRAPIVPIPVLTEAEHAAWTAYIRSRSAPSS